MYRRVQKKKRFYGKHMGAVLEASGQLTPFTRPTMIGTISSEMRRVIMYSVVLLQAALHRQLGSRKKENPSASSTDFPGE